jgi:type IV pilus biogenesis protein CpaD/CtpE
VKLTHIGCTAAIALMLAGCAGSATKPMAVEPLPMEQRSDLKLSDISADAAEDVEMSGGDFGLICEKVRAYIDAVKPGAFVNGASASALKMQIHFTRFNRGNAFARALSAGLGQIRIVAIVSLVDQSGRKVAEYKVVKNYWLGGIAGATTSVEDVEEGFAKSVAEVVR